MSIAVFTITRPRSVLSEIDSFLTLSNLFFRIHFNIIHTEQKPLSGTLQTYYSGSAHSLAETLTILTKVFRGYHNLPI